MKQTQKCTAWLLTLVLVGVDACRATSTGTEIPQSTPSQQAEVPEVNLTADGLDELLAPVALYPDPVLAVMLQASVDPQEVMDGGNWLVLDQNQNLSEAALDEASKKAGFTPVTQALLHYRTVVDLMCSQFDWTKQLGAAYQANPRAVLDSVQRLRAQAVDTGALKSSPQMKCEVTQDNGQQVVLLQPANPKVVYIPQYNPDQVFQTTTTTTTKPDGTSTTTTTTTSGPAPATASSKTTVVTQPSGVSTGTAVAIGLLSFGAGIAVGTAINRNTYYYPAWGSGAVWFGPGPYYPVPYRPVYFTGWYAGYYYHRPPHYRYTFVYVNNRNYYYRFDKNNNLRPDYRPRPVPYNKNPNSTYSRNMGSRPESRRGVSFRPGNEISANPKRTTGSVADRSGGAGGGAGTKPGSIERPTTKESASSWKGLTTYQGNKGTNSQPNKATLPTRNPSGDRGFAQNGGMRPSTGNIQSNRPDSVNTPSARPSNNAGNVSLSKRSATSQSAPRPASSSQPSARPSLPSASQTPRPSGSPVFAGADDPKGDRAASNRGRASMGKPEAPSVAPTKKAVRKS